MDTGESEMRGLGARSDAGVGVSGGLGTPTEAAAAVLRSVHPGMDPATVRRLAERAWGEVRAARGIG